MARKHKKTVALVLGGVRSGKSRYAQELASKFDPVTFIATARPSDAEMRRKIAAHRRERPAHWRTIEATINLEAAVRSAGPRAQAIVIDCLTTYLANRLSARNGKDHHARSTVLSQIGEELCTAIESVEASVIIVSNEVGSGIVPAFHSGRVYRDLLGSLNQRVAETADKVILMVAGLPLTIKGREAKLC